MTIEKVSQEDMLSSFKERMESLLKQNQEMIGTIRQNEQTILKLKGAIEALEYFVDPPAEEEVVVDTLEAGPPGE